MSKDVTFNENQPFFNQFYLQEGNIDTKDKHKNVFDIFSFQIPSRQQSSLNSPPIMSPNLTRETLQGETTTH